MILLVASCYNQQITTDLQRACIAKLLASGQIARQQIVELFVPGAFEIPVVVAASLAQAKYDCVICLGALIKGETRHFELVADTVAHALMQISVERKTPVIFEVLTALSVEQALARSGAKGNRGEEAAMAALQMLETMRRINAPRT
ncbi:MAG: 6,7-dimethyl-8-ribityllumazine synthase [Pseudomonadota bacterium]|nr:6,7-dimethyl-8-ribityllumazine synthase [Pseudomonadota bacterium]